ncbi:MAG: Asp-tRNA(Asn)/Glu-tRNA(Gln) amidotransferase subunit GatB [Candidatus Moraniibacteriota bacterium]
MKYFTTIGMEVHAELKTASKMFCRCENKPDLGKKPNTYICRVCTGQPGALPVPNGQAIEFVQKVGLALNCALRFTSKFDRKNYFYPDRPKGYQISQYDEPFCEHGTMEIEGKPFHITRIHLEEDTGKLTHPDGADYTLVDYNRAGVPLMELVTEPDFTNRKDARAFCQKLQQILRYLNVSDADMEKGQMRCEVNISLYPEGENRLSGTKVEVKNINSFKSVEKAIEFEIQRQSKALDKGEKIIQETRGWDEVQGVTVSQRKKESAHDYRYFPEPDIPPFRFTKEDVARLKESLPELPDDKVERFTSEYGLPLPLVMLLTESPEMSEYYEAVVSELSAKKKAGEFKGEISKADKLAANYLITEVRKFLSEKEMGIEKFPVTPKNYAEFVGIVADGMINSSAAQTVLKEMMKSPDGDTDPSHIVDRLNLAQMSDAGELEAVVASILEKNEKSVADFKAGKDKALQFLLGQTMAATKGKANPSVVKEILEKKLKG